MAKVASIVLAISFGFFLVNCMSTKKSSDTKLIGGQPASHNQFPSAVRIWACTATRVAHDQFVLAAHCVSSIGSSRADMIMNRYVPGRSINIEYGLTLEESFVGIVSETHVHPLWTEYSRSHDGINGPEAHDIAILTVANPGRIPAGIKISPVGMSNINIGSEIVLTGFGCEGDARNPSNRTQPRLKFARVTLDDKRGTVGISKDMNNRVCAGDSGGGVYMGNGTAAIIGVNSYKFPARNQPSVYTRFEHPSIRSWLGAKLHVSPSQPPGNVDPGTIEPPLVDNDSTVLRLRAVARKVGRAFSKCQCDIELYQEQENRLLFRLQCNGSKKDYQTRLDFDPESVASNIKNSTATRRVFSACLPSGNPGDQEPIFINPTTPSSGATVDLRVKLCEEHSGRLSCPEGATDGCHTSPRRSSYHSCVRLQ
jgi:hypothetical protein